MTITLFQLRRGPESSFHLSNTYKLACDIDMEIHFQTQIWPTYTCFIFFKFLGDPQVDMGNFLTYSPRDGKGVILQKL